MSEIKIVGLENFGITSEIAAQLNPEIVLKVDLSEIKQARLIFAEVLNSCNESTTDYTLTEIKEKFQEIIDNKDDENGYYLDTDSAEAFIINDSHTIQALIDRNDAYHLGMFNTEFIQNYVPIDYDVIKTMQEAEAWEAIGKIIESGGKVKEMMEDYISVDGIGHAFGSYDHNSNETYGTLEGNDFHYHVMRYN